MNLKLQICWQWRLLIFVKTTSRLGSAVVLSKHLIHFVSLLFCRRLWNLSQRALPVVSIIPVLIFYFQCLSDLWRSNFWFSLAIYFVDSCLWRFFFIEFSWEKKIDKITAQQSINNLQNYRTRSLWEMRLFINQLRPKIKHTKAKEKLKLNAIQRAQRWLIQRTKNRFDSKNMRFRCNATIKDKITAFFYSRNSRQRTRVINAKLNWYISYRKLFLNWSFNWEYSYWLWRKNLEFPGNNQFFLQLCRVWFLMYERNPFHFSSNPCKSKVVDCMLSGRTLAGSFSLKKKETFETEKSYNSSIIWNFWPKSFPMQSKTLRIVKPPTKNKR